MDQNPHTFDRENAPSRRDVLGGLPLSLGAAAGVGSLLAMNHAASAQQDGQQGGGGGGGGGGEFAQTPMTQKLQKVMSAMYDGNKYTLPPLPYPYDALEPAIDQVTMELHHDKHHQGYVDGLNKTVEALNGTVDDAAKLAGLQRNLSFNYGGHILHSIFWAVMGPGEDGNMGGEPSGRLANAIESDLGGFEQFKQSWLDVAGTVKGSGWVILVFDPVSKKLAIKGVSDHDEHVPAGTMPILPLDIWEHAYYLSYQNRKGDYVKAFLDVVDWQTVNSLYEMVSAPYRQQRQGQ